MNLDDEKKTKTRSPRRLEAKHEACNLVHVIWRYRQAKCHHQTKKQIEI